MPFATCHVQHTVKKVRKNEPNGTEPQASTPTSREPDSPRVPVSEDQDGMGSEDDDEEHEEMQRQAALAQAPKIGVRFSSTLGLFMNSRR